VALLLRAEELKGLISIEEAIAAVENGFRDQGEYPQFSLPRQRMMAGDRRINIHSGGCVNLSVAGTFIHYERHRYTKEDQSYGAAGKRVYMAYDSETAKLLTIIVGSLPLYDFDDNDIATETAITSAVGTKHLARQDCRVMGLYGTGRQARRHLKVMCATSYRRRDRSDRQSARGRDRRGLSRLRYRQQRPGPVWRLVGTGRACHIDRGEQQRTSCGRIG